MGIRAFFQHVYQDDRARLQSPRRLWRDVLLYTRNRLAQPMDLALTAVVRDASQPIVFIVGAPRSGTTLTFQLMARGLEVTYPTNRVARWFSAPVVGSVLAGPRPWRRQRDVPLRSTYGGTEGPDSPHEFSWFWNYHAPFFDHDDKTWEELDALPWRRIRSSLEGLAGLAGRPVVLKSLNWTVYNIERFAHELPQARFVVVERDPRFVVQSILKCRRERYGDEQRWWTIRPRDVSGWLNRDPVEQVVHQVLDIQRAIEEGVRGLPSERYRRVSYPELVSDPRGFIEAQAGWLGARTASDVIGTDELDSRDRVVDPERFTAIEQALLGAATEE